jgi:hypothetical protein
MREALPEVNNGRVGLSADTWGQLVQCRLPGFAAFTTDCACSVLIGIPPKRQRASVSWRATSGIHCNGHPVRGSSVMPAFTTGCTCSVLIGNSAKTSASKCQLVPIFTIGF